MPDAPHPHPAPTVRTAQGVPTRALLVPLPGGQPSDDLHCALDHALHRGQGRLIGNDLLEDTPVPRGLYHHRVAPSWGVGIVNELDVMSRPWNVWSTLRMRRWAGSSRLA